MISRNWDIVVDGEAHTVGIELDSFLGKLEVKIDGESFELPPKFLTFFTGRREQFTLGDKPAILKIEPLGKVTIIAGGKTYQ